MENNEKTQQDARPANILERAAREQAGFSRSIYELSGYETITTFWADLTIAEAYGIEGVRDTYRRVNESWRDNYRYYTEFVLVLNHKIWYWYEKNDALARLYDELWREADQWAADNYTGEAYEYYFNVTD